MKPNWNRSWAGKGSELDKVIRPFRKIASRIPPIVKRKDPPKPPSRRKK